MAKRFKYLFLFTGEFPYGITGEPFLNEEIKFLAEEFEKVFVFPRAVNAHTRVLPDNASPINILCFQSFTLRNVGISYLLKSLMLIIKESIINNKISPYIKNLRHYLYIGVESIIISEKINNYIRTNNYKPSEILFYTYWFDSSNLACSLLKKRDSRVKLITRVHGFDLYDKRNVGGLVPFRAIKTCATDKIYAISKQGLEYFISRIHRKFHNKVELSYLGVLESKYENIRSEKEKPIIVSCSRLEKFKRVDLIADTLLSINKPMHWVHFGGGPALNELVVKTSGFPAHITCDFSGQVSNDVVLEFYSTNKVDLFVSASESEGLPVTMMEAISFGIPIVGFNVGGVGEIIINGLTGFLVEDVNDYDAFKAKICEGLYSPSLEQDKIISFFRSNFNAEVNYKKFAEEIACL